MNAPGEAGKLELAALRRADQRQRRRHQRETRCRKPCANHHVGDDLGWDRQLYHMSLDHQMLASRQQRERYDIGQRIDRRVAKT